MHGRGGEGTEAVERALAALGVSGE